MPGDEKEIICTNAQLEMHCQYLDGFVAGAGVNTDCSFRPFERLEVSEDGVCNHVVIKMCQKIT